VPLLPVRVLGNPTAVERSRACVPQRTLRADDQRA
jgi:hypothetical protein